MSLKSSHKIEPSFSMSSMTDIIFLLLVFFMLTSSFITPSGLPINLPTSKNSTVELQKITVTVTKELEYYVNDKNVSKFMIESELKKNLSKTAEGIVVLHIDKDVPTEHLVYIADIATKLETKVSIATKPN